MNIINNTEDHVFYIKWEDSEKKDYKIGLLAFIDNNFYLKMNTQENSAEAYNKGCIGLPGFNNDRVYKSDRLFDFFMRRILGKDSKNPFEEFKRTQCRSMIDSYFVEEVPEGLKETSKKLILDMFQNQQEMQKENSQIPSF